MSKKSIMLKLIDIKNVINMSDMFSGCYSLNNLPDISKWNIQNVTNMSYMFCDCSSLNNLPDISKWKTSKLTYYTYYNDMFNECKKIKQTPKMK